MKAAIEANKQYSDEKMTEFKTMIAVITNQIIILVSLPTHND